MSQLQSAGQQSPDAPWYDTFYTWVINHQSMCTTIVIILLAIIAFSFWSKVKAFIIMVLNDAYYRRILLVCIPVIVAGLVYVYPSSLSAAIVVLGYITSAAISEKATSIAVNHKEQELQKDLNKAQEENDKLRLIINNKKSTFIDKILRKIQSIQSSKKIKTKEDALSEISKLQYNLLAETTLFESADEALTNYTAESSQEGDLAQETLIKN
ncbi:hypothetical protein ACR2R9_000726 [Cronobacter sakazakii]|nr:MULTISPECIES: hypothetical protein [Cronobacter]EKK5196364.1 hypothetical protein [Cronobacter sakazakii]ELY2511595.1 hypothetical protein [Cronobacter malonaticus]MEB8677824.1 hypothetical protein [Cronobacter malonaticus]